MTTLQQEVPEEGRQRFLSVSTVLSMQINGVGQQQRGHVLLIAGDAAVRRGTVQVEPSANLAALSTIPVPALLNSNVPSDTTYLDGARDQQALLMRLRAAAATPGPLLIYLSGRLTVDRRGRQLYLALNGTTPATTRYTALPWQWLSTELRDRPPGLTTVMFDLAADKGAWPLLQEYGTLPATTTAEAYGVVTPPAFNGEGASTYTRQWIQQLRSTTARPSNARLHALALSAATLPPDTLTIPTTREINISPVESVPQPPKTHMQRLLAGDTSFLPGRRRRSEELTEVAPGFEHLSPPPIQLDHKAPSQIAAPIPKQMQTMPHPHPPNPPALQQTAPAPPAQDDRGLRLVTSDQKREKPTQQPVQAPHPAPAPMPPQQPTPPPSPTAVPLQQPQAAASLLTSAQRPAQTPLPHQPAPRGSQEPDPRPLIWQAAQAGRHNQAAEMAAAWEQQTLHQYGHDSPQATQWADIRADLARIAGRWMLATQLWVSATHSRLAHQPPDAPEVLNSARGAHYCWTQISDPKEAIETGPELINLLRQLPALDPRHVTTAQARLHQMHDCY
ncbi:hypothetical protein [Streptomyces lydicus]|uniref:hypothetical protein n=1 Tax=Streptomyces lydicus TaxID=47763 RepID=UPI0037B5C59A